MNRIKSFLLLLVVSLSLLGAQKNAIRVQFEPLRNPDCIGGISTVDAVEVQCAIEQLGASILDVASPGYVFTKAGAVSNAWLNVGIVPSNKVGVNFGFFNGELSTMTVANEDVGTFDVELHEHDGATFTLLTTVSVVASRSAEFDSGDFGTVTLTKGLELAAKIVNGSAKNPIVTVQANGTLAP